MSDLVNRRADAKPHSKEIATHAPDTDTHAKESEQSVRARMGRERDPPSLGLGMPTGSISVRNETDIPLRGRNRALRDPAIPLLGIYPDGPNTYS